MIKIRAYKTNLGLFITSTKSCFLGSDILSKKFKYNNKSPKSTNHKDWLLIEDEAELQSISQLIKGRQINHRYEIKDIEDISDKTPKYFTREEVGFTYDGDGDWVWAVEKLRKYYSWYEEIHDIEEDSWGEIEFEIEYVGEVEISSIDKPKDIKYTVYRSNHSHQGTVELDLSSISIYSELDKILVPGFALHSRPCSITSEQTYNIVRQYIKENINPKNAIVTSDYDFCFTVEKNIKIKPWDRIYEIKKKNGRSYAKPKLTRKSVTMKQEQIFEMTNKQDNYKGYTPIIGFSGNTLQELVENVKGYLEELIYYINVEVSECEHCSGTGNIIKSDFHLNKREN